jgi:polyisoprenyl-phosphate glycosyltransferase
MAEHRQLPCVVMPIFNDWPAVNALLPFLDKAVVASGRRVEVLLLDDGSTAVPPSDFGCGPFNAIDRIRILQLRRNLGHQRALAVGLAFLEATSAADPLVIMDGDGEDAPADVPRLLERFETERGQKTVFAERRRRSESLVFRVFYALYRGTHLVMTGTRVRVGNFSVLPRRHLHTLVVVSEMWNHYAASVFKARLPFVTVPTERAKRLSGQSSMNYVNLVVHGLSAISVYSDIVGVRALAGSMLLIAAAALGIAIVTIIRFFTALAIPGWATVSVGILLVILLQAVLFSMLFSFSTLASRQGFSFLPARDYPYFAGAVVDVYPARG